MKKFLPILKNKKFVFWLVVFVVICFGVWAIYASQNKVLPQSAIHFLNDIPSPRSGDRILVFSPHPDDESIGVGGYIYDAEKAGASVRIVLVTDGNKHGLRDKRYAEFRQAATVLGVPQSDLVFLNHADGSLVKVRESTLEKEFQSAIDNFQPNIIFYPYVKDDHPDHAYTGTTAEKLVDRTKMVAYEYLVHANYYPQPQRYSPDDYLLPPEKLVTFDNEWQRYMISYDTEMKMKTAFESYKTQVKNPLINILFLSSVRKNEIFMVTGVTK